jgi:hypothetical protein
VKYQADYFPQTPSHRRPDYQELTPQRSPRKLQKRDAREFPQDSLESSQEVAGGAGVNPPVPPPKGTSAPQQPGKSKGTDVN